MIGDTTTAILMHLYSAMESKEVKVRDAKHCFSLKNCILSLQSS